MSQPTYNVPIQWRKSAFYVDVIINYLKYRSLYHVNHCCIIFRQEQKNTSQTQKSKLAQSVAQKELRK